MDWWNDGRVEEWRKKIRTHHGDTKNTEKHREGRNAMIEDKGRMAMRLYKRDDRQVRDFRAASITVVNSFLFWSAFRG